MPIQKIISDDLEAILSVIPPRIKQALEQPNDKSDLLEIVLDLGRLPKARFPNREIAILTGEVTREDLDHVVMNISDFGGDNRAGIERTLHRISAIRNRQGQIVGLTIRVGRAVFGTVTIIRDLVESGKSVLLLGRPGVGKTTMLREVARVLAEDLNKRVIIVDTSNEIAGDGDIPHPAIGRARRMQVALPSLQHNVMIEAVENHMPEVIIIDEIGTELEAQAARTIAERGVQLIGTAHGSTLDNLILNPTLSDLAGGIQSVTLGDEEAKRRGTQKSILERKAPPTFQTVVEIQNWEMVVVHPDVAIAVDNILRGDHPQAEIRYLDQDGQIKTMPVLQPEAVLGKEPTEVHPLSLYLFGVNRAILEKAAREMNMWISINPELETSDFLLTTRNYYNRKPQIIRDAEGIGKPVYVLKGNKIFQVKNCLRDLKPESVERPVLFEAKEAIYHISNGETEHLELSPQISHIRQLQHLLAERHRLNSRSIGSEPTRRVVITNKKRKNDRRDGHK